jgi:hypothetical protein
MAPCRETNLPCRVMVLLDTVLRWFRVYRPGFSSVPASDTSGFGSRVPIPTVSQRFHAVSVTQLRHRLTCALRNGCSCTVSLFRAPGTAAWLRESPVPPRTLPGPAVLVRAPLSPGALSLATAAHWARPMAPVKSNIVNDLRYCMAVLPVLFFFRFHLCPS